MKDQMTADALTDALVRRGLIREPVRPVPPSANDRPWYISAVLGAAGWLAGMFTLSFVALIFRFRGEAAYAIAGTLMVGAAFGLYVKGRDSAFVGQLALALSIGGQLGLMVAASTATESIAETAALMVVLQAVLLRVMPNPMARTLAAFFACLTWVIAIRFAWWGDDLFGEARQEVSLLTALLTWLVIWAPLIALTRALVALEARWMAGISRRIARPALTGLLVALALATWASEPFATVQFWVTSGATATNWLALWPLLGAATALYAAICAFRLRDRALLGVAIVGALLHVSHLYYLLGVTLLLKSCIMLAVGCALLAAAWILRQRRGAPAGGAPA